MNQSQSAPSQFIIQDVTACAAGGQMINNEGLSHRNFNKRNTKIRTMNTRQGSFLLLLLAVLMVFLYVSFETDLFRSRLFNRLNVYTNSSLQFISSITTLHGDVFKQKNSTTTILQKSTANKQTTTKSRSKAEMQKNASVTISRLIFNKSSAQFWAPLRALNVGQKQEFPEVNCVENRTMLIVIVNCPSWLSQAINNHTMKTCRCSNCLLSQRTSDIPKADAVLFNAGKLPFKPPQRRRGQPWAIFHWESPVLTPKTMGRPKWRGVFNWTMTYTIDSDLFAPVGMFVPTEISNSYHHLLNIVQKKTKIAAWFVSHCNTVSRRSEYVKRLQKIIDVDIFGRCGTKACRRDNSECFQKLNHTYKFYLSFENAFCKDYITEKLYKTFNVPCVPVVRGGADYKHLVPKGTYINAADFKSPEDLGWYLKQLSDDIPAYMDILMRKEQYKTFDSRDGKQMAFCELCYVLNNQSVKRNIHKDVGKWLRGKCHAPTDL